MKPMVNFTSRRMPECSSPGKVKEMFLHLAYKLYRLQWLLTRPIVIGVRIMLVKDGKALLVRHTYIDGWYLPGGGVKRGETLEEAARREAREEVGANMKAVELLGAYSNFNEYKSDHNLLFLCTDFSLSGQPDREIAEVRFFPLDGLPENVWPGHRLRLEEYRAGSAHPQFGEW
jgi:ADP-ribose pyrophosphatase YjhB (NUDIX family)